MGFSFHEEHVLSNSQAFRSVLHDLRDQDDNQMVVMHIDVFEFSPSVLKRMKREFNALRQCTDAILFAIEDKPDDPKWEKFVRIMGFDFLSRVECTDGRSRRCFVSTKKKNDDFKHERDFVSAVRSVASPAAIPPAGLRAGADEPR